MKKITAVVMCSGLSRRMGENKLFIPFNGKKMYQHTLDTVIKSGFYRVNVVTSYDEIAKKYQGLYDRVDVIINKNSKIVLLFFCYCYKISWKCKI